MVSGSTTAARLWKSRDRLCVRGTEPVSLKPSDHVAEEPCPSSGETLRPRTSSSGGHEGRFWSVKRRCSAAHIERRVDR